MDVHIQVNNKYNNSIVNIGNTLRKYLEFLTSEHLGMPSDAWPHPTTITWSNCSLYGCLTAWKILKCKPHVVLKIKKTDWLRALSAVTREPDFSQTHGFCGITKAIMLHQEKQTLMEKILSICYFSTFGHAWLNSTKNITWLNNSFYKYLTKWKIWSLYLDSIWEIKVEKILQYH